MRKKVSIILAALALGACSTVTIEQHAGVDETSPPDYQETQNYFFWGLVGEKHINTSEICNGGEVSQMQSQATFTNGFFTLITLGIYAPHSAKVWCVKGSKDGGAA